MLDVGFSVTSQTAMLCRHLLRGSNSGCSDGVWSFNVDRGHLNLHTENLLVHVKFGVQS